MIPLLLTIAALATDPGWKPVDPDGHSAVGVFVSRDARELPVIPWVGRESRGGRDVIWPWWKSASGEYAYSPTKPHGNWSKVIEYGPEQGVRRIVYNDARLPESPFWVNAQRRDAMIWFIDSSGRLLYARPAPASTGLDGDSGEAIEQFKEVVGK